MKERTAIAANIHGNVSKITLGRMKIAYNTWTLPEQPDLAKGSINAKYFGVKGDGITDNTVKIQELINSLPPKGTIFFSAGHYKINGQIKFSKGISILGESGTVFDCSSVSKDVFMVNYDEYSQNTTTLTQDVYSGGTSLAVSDSSNLFRGDYIKIYDNESINEFTKGEILKIAIASENSINLETPVIDTYRTDLESKVRKLNFIEDVLVSGIEFIGPGEETEPYLIRAFMVKNFQFLNCKVKMFGRAAVGLTDCLDSSFTRNVFENIFKTGFGYSIVITNCSNNITITDNFFMKKGRHYIAVGGETGTYLSGGFPKTIDIKNNLFEDSTDEAINTHSPFAGPISISDNVFNRCVKGIEITNGKSLVSNNSFLNCVNAVEFLEDNDIQPGFHTAPNNIFINNDLAFYNVAPNISIINNILIKSALYCNPTKSCCIEGNYIAGVTSTKNPIEVTGDQLIKAEKVDIKDNLINDCRSDYSIKLSFAESVSIINNTFKNSGCISTMFCSKVFIRNNVQQKSFSWGSSDFATKYTLTMEKDGQGTVTPVEGEHEYLAGTSVTLKAAAAEGWEFVHWLINGEAISNMETKIELNGNLKAKAVFIGKEIILTIDSNASKRSRSYHGCRSIYCFSNIPHNGSCPVCIGAPGGRGSMA